MTAIPEWVADYVGLPFLEGGRARDGIDCYGLLRLVINERFGGALPDYEGIAYQDGGDNGRLAALMAERIALWSLVEAGREREGDGILLRALGRAIHVGVVVAPGVMLHVERGCNSIIERYAPGSNWSRRVLGFYRHAV